MLPDPITIREVKPVLAGYIREAQVLLGISPVPDDRVVHDVRVLMKKSRAVMRLIKNQTGEASYKRNYESFREVGRLMNNWRETAVQKKTLKEIKKNHPVLFFSLEGSEINKLLIENEASVGLADKIGPEVKKINQILEKSGFRLRFLKIEKSDPKTLIGSLEETYNKVIEKYLIARYNPKPPNLHQFRKKSKDFLYQLWFFRPLNPSRIKSIEKKIDGLSQRLGKYNDLAEIVSKIDYGKKTGPEPSPLDELMIILRNEQDKYLMDVWPDAYKLFCPGKKMLNVLGFSVPEY
jgi:hypothetical protein